MAEIMGEDMQNLMIKHQKLLIFLGIIAFFYVSYKIAYPSYAWNQKLTVEVETPEGVVIGSSVVAVKWRQYPDVWQEIRSVRDSHEGEASIIELPNGKYLFVLLSNATPSLALHVFATSKVGSGMDPRIVPASEVNSHKGEIKSIPGVHYPLFVTFDDLDDPASVKRVDPDDLEASFGEGYSLKSATLEITDEEITEGRIVDLLPWFNWPRQKSLEYGGGSNPLKMPNDSPRGYQSLSKLEFRRAL